jgi:hypothetical protein
LQQVAQPMSRVSAILVSDVEGDSMKPIENFAHRLARGHKFVVK